MAERVRAVEEAPRTAEELARRHFTRAKPADLAEILETLTALGHAHRDGERFSV